ncbi:MAG: hypothetical protein ACRC56_11935 [Bosea sp. (in: a-proteobacteria)]
MTSKQLKSYHARKGLSHRIQITLDPETFARWQAHAAGFDPPHRDRQALGALLDTGDDVADELRKLARRFSARED